ncbi:MAG: TolC family protein, partial [bacterium]
MLFTSLAVLAGAGGVTPRSLSAEDLGLTLLEAVDTALKENLSIRSDQYGISISESVVMAEEGAFDPFFRIEVTNEDTEVESASTLTATEEDVLRGDAVFGGRLRTGGTYELKLSNENVDSNLGFLLENPYYRSELTVSFTQPILKGVGRSVQESRLDVARNNLQIARLQLSATAVDVVAETMKAYWELHFAIDNLEVVKLSLELAWSLLDEVRARISAGEMASIEIYQAEAEVALRQGNVILARKALEDSEDRLKAAMGLIGWGAGIRPVTDPPPPLDPPPLDLAMRAAFENRKDYLQARLEARNKGILKRYYGNQKRSELDVIAATGINGVDGQYNEALSEMLEADSLSWQVGLLYT